MEYSATVAYCSNCMNLLYLNGVPKCAEYNFLLTPADLVDDIECSKYLPLSDLRSFKRYTGTSGKMQVTEETVLETVISLAVQKHRGVTIAEIHSRLPLNRAGLFAILQRLVDLGQLFLSKILVTYPDAPRRKQWQMNAYWPTRLTGRIQNET